jgi:flagellar biosynthesis protein
MALKSKGVYDIAVGLAYEEGVDPAPEVIVKGEGLEADEIVRLANRYGVPVVEKEELSELLKGIPLDETIPADLYEAVALILSELKSFRP